MFDLEQVLEVTGIILFSGTILYLLVSLVRHWVSILDDSDDNDDDFPYGLS